MTTRRATLALMGAAAALPALAGDRPIGRAFAGRSAAIARSGMAATSQPLATQAALDILKKGGSAVDAAIAANACLGLMEPTGCGIGGDLFAIVWDPKTSKLHALNASGPAPKGQTLQQLQDKQKGRRTISPWGAGAVSVPGCVEGWLQLNQRFGRLRMADILAPAIGYGRDGFPLSPVIADGWARNLARFQENRASIEDLAPAWKVFAPNGAAPKAGQLYTNKDLAAAYTNIAVFGREWFYDDYAADVIDQFMRRIGGALRKEDFAAFRAEWVEPIRTTYRGVEVVQIPPNSQGISVLQLLNILEGFDIAKMGFGSVDALHVCAEAKKLVFADRARLIADPKFSNVPMAELLSKERAAKQRAQIRMGQAGPAAAGGLRDGDTIYLATADASGMMVSFIQSNYRGMGSGLMPDGLGFMLQNRGAQFSLDPAHANAYAPGKRPFHTIIPGFAMKGGAPWLAFGVMGGDMQPQGHAQIIMNMVDFGMDPQEAGDAPRWRHIGGPDPGDGGGPGDALYLERGFAEARAGLAARGHTFAQGYQDVGGYQAVMREGGAYWGATEMRKDGAAAGY